MRATATIPDGSAALNVDVSASVAPSVTTGTAGCVVDIIVGYLNDGNAHVTRALVCAMTSVAVATPVTPPEYLAPSVNVPTAAKVVDSGLNVRFGP